VAEIDILKMELDGGLPHWLSPEARMHGKLDAKRDAIRKKHRDRYLAERERRRGLERLGVVVNDPGPTARTRAALDRTTRAVRAAFDPDEPRDEEGKWTDGGDAPLDKDGNALVDMDNKPAKANDDGTLTLYHRTTPEAAAEIQRTGKFKSLENTDETFFSTQRDGPNSAYGAAVVVANVHPSKTRINDAFHGGEIHVAVENRHLSKASIHDVILHAPPLPNEPSPSGRGTVLHSKIMVPPTSDAPIKKQIVHDPATGSKKPYEVWSHYKGAPPQRKASFKRESAALKSEWWTFGEEAKQGGEAKPSNEQISDFAEATKAKHGLQALSMFMSAANHLRLDTIIVPKEKQGQGVGTAAMKDITAFADQHDLPMSLTTGQRDKHHGTTSSGRLKTFYKRFGFVENKGRWPEVSDNMVRPRKSERKGAKAFEQRIGQFHAGRPIIDDRADPAHLKRSTKLKGVTELTTILQVHGDYYRRKWAIPDAAGNPARPLVVAASGHVKVWEFGTDVGYVPDPYRETVKL